MPLAVPNSGQPVFQRANFAVAEALRDGIIGGELAPGEVIAEEDVARVLGVSRTPVREALLLLAGEQLVSLSNARGQRATVREMDLDELSQIFVLRGMLEGHAARLAAVRISSDQLARLEQSCKRMSAIGAGNVPLLIAENSKFHSTILEAAGSERLAFIVKTLLQIPFAYKEDFWRDSRCLKSDIAGHRKVIKALRAGDADLAAIAMSHHLEDVGDLSLQKLGRRPAGASA